MKRLFLAALLSCIGVNLMAQPSSIAGTPQSMAVLPGEPQSISLIDSAMFVSIDRLKLVSQERNGTLYAFVPDTFSSKIASNIVSIVREPNGKGYYYTSRDRRGRLSLHYAYQDGKRMKSNRLDMDGLEVYQPAFSDDGNVLVFSSRDKSKSFGGRDLWYSRRDKDQWSKPHNLGNRINTAGDEITPFIYGDYLFFASNGRDESKGKMNIFVTQLFNDGIVSDSVGMLHLGRGQVQRMPEPFNAPGLDCSHLVIDARQGSVFWYRNQQLWGSTIPLYCQSVWGYVVDADDRPLAGVEVSVGTNHRSVCSVATDATGFYHFALPAGKQFNVSFTKANCFSVDTTLTTRRDLNGLLIADLRFDQVLDALPVNRAIHFADLFAPNASVELNSHGREILSTIARFLTDNPHLGATFMLKCDVVADVEFNALLTSERIRTLQTYLQDILPSSISLVFENMCEGDEGCSDATGESHLVVLLR